MFAVQKSISRIFLVTSIFLLFSLLPLSADAAALSFSPASGSYAVGSTFTVSVYVSSADQSMNAASGIVSFPADKLEVLSVSKAGSIFSLWVQEPTFSNSAGTVSFEGIVLNPGFTGNSAKILSVTFRAKSAGIAATRFSSAAALANDGEGTNILKSSGTAAFTLTPVTTVAPVIPEPTTPTVPTETKKRSYFDISEVDRKDPTDPTVEFEFDISSDWDIDYFKVTIDGKDFGILDDDDTDSYETSVLAPGEHTIIVKAVDKDGTARSSSADFIIKPLDTPVLTAYPRELMTGEILSVKGQTYPDSKVNIVFHEKLRETQSFEIKSDKRGEFMFVTDDELFDGTYTLTAEVVDERGAKSLPTDPITILVSQSRLLKSGSIAVDVLSVVIPLILLLLGLLLVLWYGWHKVFAFKRKLHKKVHGAEMALHKSFGLLRADMHENVGTLEKAESKRKLTREESKILKKLRKDLADVEKFLEKEIGNIDKAV